ncbi:MAG: ABC transporter permease [Rhodospirillaceae bacterium]|nr:ABC transporter permease [Rhodospirillaceae bacterium]
MTKLYGNQMYNIDILSHRKKISAALIFQVPALIVVFFILAPIFNIIFVSLGDNKDLLSHLMETVLTRYFFNTIILIFGVGILATIFGVSSGWIISRYNFWGRKTLSWMLVLPAAIPAYLIAFTYTDFLEYAGPVQTYLRLLFGWNGPRDYWFPDVRTHFGAILMMACVLYPYIYIFVRTAFQRISRTLFEAAALTGKPLFSSVAIPLARPAIIASLSLVLMEVVSDFGTVDYFGIETLTLGIFNVWLGMNNIVAAAQISLIAFILILLLLALERYARSNRLFSNKSPGVKGMPRIELEPKLQLICFLICGLPVLIGFILPVMILISFVIKSDEVNAIQYLYETFYNTILISLVSALIIIFISSFLSIVSFYRLNKSTQFFAGLSATGYAFPGTILAIGILHFLAQIESTAQLFISGFIPYSNEVIVSGTIFVLIIAYLTRFNAVGFGSVTAGLEQIPQDLISASQILGKRFGSSVGAVLLPNLWPAILAGGLLLFVDIMKELPLTLLLRPMDFETFATITYQLAKSEMLEQAAYPALCIVVSGLIPVVIANIALSKIAEK